MKSTGMVRQLDTLGRIVIPVELRRTMDLSLKDTLEIFVDGDQIVLKKSCLRFLQRCPGRDLLQRQAGLPALSGRAAQRGAVSAFLSCHPILRMAFFFVPLFCAMRRCAALC